MGTYSQTLKNLEAKNVISWAILKYVKAEKVRSWVMFEKPDGWEGKFLSNIKYVKAEKVKTWVRFEKTYGWESKFLSNIKVRQGREGKIVSKV